MEENKMKAASYYAATGMHKQATQADCVGVLAGIAVNQVPVEQTPIEALYLSQQHILEVTTRLEALVERLVGPYPVDPIGDFPTKFGGVAGEVERISATLLAASRRIHAAAYAVERALP